MSISLSAISKTGKVDVFYFLENYIKSLNFLFADSELESFVYSKRNKKSVISLAIENESISLKSTKKLLIQNINIANKNILVLKIEHENSKESRLTVLKELSFLKDIKSKFVVLEQTVMFDNIKRRPPRLTDKGNLYFPVGKITTYFSTQSENKDYQDDKRGLEYTKANNTDDIVLITDKYYSRFIDGNLEGLTDIKQTGLNHFSTIIHDLDGQLNVSFLQNSNIKIARYFFDPEIYFCSNEPILRFVRGLQFGDVDIKMKRNLKAVSFKV